MWYNKHMRTSRFHPGRPRGAVAGLTLVSVLLIAAMPSAAGAAAPIVENRGQWPDDVRFVARDGATSVTFTAAGPVVRSGAGEAAITLVGAGSPGAPVGRAPHPTRWNFFRGPDAHTWRTSVPGWTEVVYRDVWPGVDVCWQVRAGGLQWRLDPTGDSAPPRTAVRPPNLPVLRVTDADDGRAGTISWGAPTAAPADGRDAGPLVWSTYLGASDSDKGLGVAVGPDGCPVVVGRSRSPDFPTPGGVVTDPAGLNDVFVLKLSPSGDSVVWGTFLGSDGDDAGMGLAIAPDGEVVVVGLASGADWPVTAGAFATTASGQRDAVAARLGAGGDTLVWSTYLGGASNDLAIRVRLDATGCPVIGGATQSPDWPTTPGAFDQWHDGGWDAFLARLSSDGTQLLASTLLGGTGDEEGRAMDLRPDGLVVLVGSTRGSVFPTTPGAFATGPAGAEDAWAACLDATDASLVWSTLLGGAENDVATRVACDAAGRAVVVGGTRSADFPTTAGAHDTTHNGNDDAFVSVVAPDGASLAWSSLLGGGDADRAMGVALDDAGRVTLLGYTLSDDLPTTPAAYDTSANGSYDVFVHQFTTDGGGLRFGSYLGGLERDEIFSATHDDAGRLLLVGVSESADFPVTAGCYQPEYGGLADAFVAAVDPAAWLATTSPAPGGDPGLRCYPNPANPRATVAFDVPRAGPVTVRVVDLRGRAVRTLLTRSLTAGTHRLVWDGRDRAGLPVASGTYVCEVRTPGGRRTTRLGLVR
jgi:hypothetical protein